MTKTSLQPFPFDKLKKLTRQEGELFSHLASYFPGQGYDPPLLLKMTETLKKYLGPTFSLRYESVFAAPYEKFVAGLPSLFACFVVSLTPLPKKIMIELDSDFAFCLVDRMLGGAGDQPQNLHPFTSLEEGVLQFVAVRLLKELSSLMPKAPYQFRFDKIVSLATAVSNLDEAQESVILITFRVRLNQTNGYIRLCLPHPVALQLFVATSNVDTSERAKNFEHFRTSVWAEVGKVTLTAGEMRRVQRGDIVLFDDSHPDFDGKKISGNICLRVGDGAHGGIHGTLEEGEALRVKVGSLFDE